MIWFKIKELEKVLEERKLSDYLAFKYLMAHLLLYALLDNFPAQGEEDPLWSLYTQLFIALIAISWGIGKTFEINRAGDDKEYLKRIISLSLVASLRTIVVFFILAAIMSTAILFADRMDYALNDFWNEIIELIVQLLLIVVYYKILLTSFKRINSFSKNHPEPV